MMPVGAGNRSTLCSFEASAEVPDGGGGKTITWAEQFQRWGGFAFPKLSAKLEGIAAGAVQSKTQADLVVPDDSETRTIDHTWRVVALGRAWNITGVEPSHATGDLRLTVESGVAT